MRRKGVEKSDIQGRILRRELGGDNEAILLSPTHSSLFRGLSARPRKNTKCAKRVLKNQIFKGEFCEGIAGTM
jgi:hypothetical protein